MSALSRDIHKSHPELNVHEFRQEKPVPSYAVVIAVGSLRERECNKRISIFAEEKTFQSHVDRFRYKAIENMLVYAEHNLCGPYTWGRYDICVLPPSIAHFEIECPCVTFVSPLLLGGDSSYIVSSLARNISQSWAGNLVTCCNYEHLWLNKSFSIFISRKIKRKMLYHEDIDVFLQREGLKNLNSLIPRKPADAVLLRCLLPNLKGTSELPHIITKYVPYERGYFLLCHLEHILGGPTVFEPFLQSYFNDFSRQSINTTDWLNYLRQKFLDKVELLDGVEWRVWFNRIFFTFSMPVMTLWEEKCFTLAEKLIKYETRDVLPLTADVNNLHDVQKIILLKCLHSSHRRLTTETLNSIPASFFHYSRNYEIRYLWLLLCIKVRCDEKVKPALKFAVKYCSPNYACCIFKYLCKWEIMRPQTMRIFHENEEKMLDDTREKLNKILYPSNLFLSELV
ncbi:leukotriene A-4 hydrolase-like [Temnothorax nylanderi]|uniref:leukotriene A-4 hydrolase-like n=1 Tax=Temnothorax nylanderi TaxID=102681 RepID=UPI003A886934